MSSGIPKEILAKLQEYANLTGRTLDDVMRIYATHYANRKNARPNDPHEKLAMEARYLTYLQLKSEMRTSAIQFEGIILGVSPVRDVTEQIRDTMIQLWKTNPQEVIMQGYIVNEKGELVDNRDTLPDGRQNPFKGRVITELPLRQVIAAVVPANVVNAPIRLAVINQLGDLAKVKPELGKVYKFRAIVREDKPDKMLLALHRTGLYSSVLASKLPDVFTILSGTPQQFASTARKLMEWHNANSGDRNRVVVVLGRVSFIRREPLPSGSRIIVLEDEDVESFEEEGLTVFYDGNIDFGVGSKIYVVGRTTIGPGWNPETRQMDHNIQRVMLNAFGVFAIPEYRTEPTEDISDAIQLEG